MQSNNNELVIFFQTFLDSPYIMHIAFHNGCLVFIYKKHYFSDMICGTKYCMMLRILDIESVGLSPGPTCLM